MGIWQIHTKTGFRPIKLQESQSGPHTNRTAYNKYIYLQRSFSFSETAESKDKIYAFDTTVVHGREMYEKLLNLYKMKSIVMFRHFIAKKGVML